MQNLRFLPSYGRHGFYIIGVLIVVVIIFILLFKGSFNRDPVTQVTQSQTQLDRSRDSACAFNRNAIRTDLTHLRIMNPDMKMNMEVVRRQINIPNCSGKGVYLLGPDGTVYCTEHFPPPAEQMQQMLQITRIEPEATPIGTPIID